MQPEVEPMQQVQQSMLSWIFAALGLPLLFLLIVAGVISFVLALAIVLRGRGPLAAAALLLVVHVPLLIGIFAALQGMINSYAVIAMSDNAAKPADVAGGISTALIAPLVSMPLMIPGYLTAALGAMVRAFMDRSEYARKE